MKVSAQRGKLENLIQQVQNAVSHKTTLPILSNFLLDAGKDRIKITATDLELGISGEIEGVVQEPGTLTLPARKFSDMIHELPESEVHISSKKNQMVSIECEKVHFKLMGLPAEDFPKFPQLDEKISLTLNQSVLKEMIKMTSFAMSNDETRYVLNGIYFLVKGKLSRMVATDGRRLAFIERALPEASLFERAVIIPTKTIHELAKILQEEGEVKVIFGENQIQFSIPGLVILSRLIEGEFPDYEQVIPKENAQKIRINRERFLFATKRTGLLTSQESQSIKLEFFKDKVILSKASPEWGEAREEVDLANEGKDLSIGFNPQYLVDVLKALPHDEVAIELAGTDKPGVIRTPDQYTYIVLPMQIA